MVLERKVGIGSLMDKSFGAATGEPSGHPASFSLALAQLTQLTKRRAVGVHVPLGLGAQLVGCGMALY